MLPFKGTLPEQPNKIIEIFNIIDGIRLRKEKEETERQKNKAHAQAVKK